MRYALIYGTIAGIIIFGLSFLVFLSGALGHVDNPIYGYLIMIVGLTMIFVGVKRYRDVEKGGVIRFDAALALGVGIAAVASIIYVAGFEIYYATPTGQRLYEMIVQMEPRYAGAFYRWIWGFWEILPVDVVMAVLSAAILRNPRVLPARA
jgi:Protein of unknown function (DUF4199)